MYQSPVKQGWPPVLWVIGGPGSNKAVLCDEVCKQTGWAHVSLGKLLRAAAEPSEHRNATDIKTIRESVSSGELVPFDIVMKMVEQQMNENISANGVIMDGYPRDMTQVTEFEAKVINTFLIILSLHLHL